MDDHASIVPLSETHPDVDQAMRFLTLLDESAEKFTFQTFDDLRTRKDRALAKIFHRALPDVATKLLRLQWSGAGVFVAVNETDGKGRRLENMRRIRAVWHEEDTPCGVSQWPLEPHMLIESSPGKYHRYWLVDGLQPDAFAGVMARMIRDYGSDPNVKDVSRVLRLPGFFHLKQPGRPFMVRMVATHERLPYTAEELLAAFPPLVDRAAAPHSKASAAAATAPAVPEAIKARVTSIASRAAARTHEVPTLGRHAMVLWMGRECAHQGFPASVGAYAVSVFERLMRPTDSTGQEAPLNVAMETKAFQDAFERGLNDPEGKRKNWMPRPGRREATGDQPEAAGGLPTIGGDTTAGGGSAGGHEPSRPEIRLGGDRLVTAMQEAERVMFSGGRTPFFSRGGMLMWLATIDQSRELQDGPVKHERGAQVLKPVSAGWLRRRMMQECLFTRYVKSDAEWVPTNLPEEYPKSYVEGGEWWAPVLRAVVHAPVMREDGSIYMEPGLDPKTGLYLAGTTAWKMPPARPKGVPIVPGKDAAIQKAIEIFADLFVPFSPEDEPDFSVLVSAVLTGLMKTVVGPAPGTIITAPVFGTGKGKLADIISIIVTGHAVPMMVMPMDGKGKADEKAFGVTLNAALIGGDRVICIDEIKGTLASPTLDSMLTQEQTQARVLGVSQMAVVRPADTLFIALGNNITVAADSSRRWLRCYLNPHCPDPHLRQFDRDALQYARENRAKLVWAALTLLHGYIHAGMPPQPGCHLGSFERWARLIPSCLVWAGFANPIRTLDAWKDQDQSRASLLGLLENWHRVLGDDPHTAATVCRSMETEERKMGDVELPRYDREFSELLFELVGEKGRLNSNRLGGLIRGQAKRVLDVTDPVTGQSTGGLVIEPAGERHRAKLWRVRAVDRRV